VESDRGGDIGQRLVECVSLPDNGTLDAQRVGDIPVRVLLDNHFDVLHRNASSDIRMRFWPHNLEQPIMLLYREPA
jgi:hypothetical protein